jgi:histidinol-phosphate/aromatic aminotransferase/cobyric acid decarboxylase-like protein
MSTQLNFAVNSIAEAAACACLDSECETEFAARLAMVADARRQLILQASSYFEALPDTPTPFVWARTFGPSRRIFEHLERDKILVAVADDRHLRITVPDRDGLARLISSLAGTAS